MLPLLAAAGVVKKAAPALKKVAQKIANKVPGKKPLGKLFKKLAGNGQVQSNDTIKDNLPIPEANNKQIVAQAVKEVIKEESSGVVNLDVLKKQPGETKEQHTNRIVEAAGGATAEFFGQAEQPSKQQDVGAAFEHGAKENVIKKYGLIAGIAIIGIGLVVYIIKKVF